MEKNAIDAAAVDGAVAVAVADNDDDDTQIGHRIEG